MKSSARALISTHPDARVRSHRCARRPRGPTSGFSTRASRRWCTSTARSAARDLAPLAHCALALMGRARFETHPANSPLPQRRWRRPGIEPADLAEKGGSASSTAPMACSGCCGMAIADLRALVTTADIAAAMSVEGLLGTDDVFAADLQALRPQPGQAKSAENMRRCWRTADPRLPPRPRGLHAFRTPIRCGAPQVAGAVRDTIDHAAGWPAGSWRRRSTTRRHAGRPGGVQWQLPRRTGRASSTSWRSPRPTWRASAMAAHRPLPRQGAQPRAAAVPGRRPRRRLGPDDRAVHRGWAGFRDEAARRPASVDSIPSSAMQRTTSRWGGCCAQAAPLGGALQQVLAIELLTAGKGESSCAHRWSPHRSAARSSLP